MCFTFAIPFRSSAIKVFLPLKSEIAEPTGNVPVHGVKLRTWDWLVSNFFLYLHSHNDKAYSYK